MISLRSEGPDRKRFRFAPGSENAHSSLLAGTPRRSGPGTRKHRRLYAQVDPENCVRSARARLIGTARSAIRVTGVQMSVGYYESLPYAFPRASSAAALVHAPDRGATTGSASVLYR